MGALLSLPSYEIIEQFEKALHDCDWESYSNLIKRERLNQMPEQVNGELLDDLMRLVIRRMELHQISIEPYFAVKFIDGLDREDYVIMDIYNDIQGKWHASYRYRLKQACKTSWFTTINNDFIYDMQQVNSCLADSSGSTLNTTYYNTLLEALQQNTSLSDDDRTQITLKLAKCMASLHSLLQTPQIAAPMMHPASQITIKF